MKLVLEIMQRLFIIPKQCNVGNASVFNPTLGKIFTRTGKLGEYPPPAKIQFKPPPGEKGFMHYERSWSGDMRYSKPQIKRTTLTECVCFYNFYFCNYCLQIHNIKFLTILSEIKNAC